MQKMYVGNSGLVQRDNKFANDVNIQFAANEKKYVHSQDSIAISAATYSQKYIEQQKS